jgi:hypothetical protein
MKEAIKKELTKALADAVAQAREMSIFTDDGRMFLDATAMLYGAAVNNQNQIIKENGEVMSEEDPDYQTIINIAKKQARAQSRIGGELSGA